MIDIVYPFILPISGDGGEELKFSLRSLEKNYSDFKVWIIGEKTEWIKNVEFIAVKKKVEGWRDVNCKIKTIVESEEIGTEFILMNDDFYFANKFSLSTISTLRASRELTEENIWEIKSRGRESHRTILKTFVKLREKRNKEEEDDSKIWDFETHLPRLFNKKLLLELYNKYNMCNNQLSIPTLYFNTYDSDGIPEIIKEHSMSNEVVLRFRSDTTYNLKVLKVLVSNKKFISNSDPGYFRSKVLLEYLFPSKSSFEK